MPGYPIELDLTGRTALVVGLGAVGRRRAAGLLEAGARVLGVDPAARAPAIGAEAEGYEVRAEPYRPGHLDGVALALAAATPAVNRRVVADAKGRGIWINSASDPAASDFRLPATWRDGPLTLTVATDGASPALAAALRDRAAAALGPDAAAFAALLAELRPMVRAQVADPDARRRLLAAWADPCWLDRWADAGPEAVRAALLAALEAGAEEGPGTAT